eukprot:TRINITY_DN267_c0_g1_i5.p1 TRINITY_DN267_c0_g1~~TRINITY_DN267_c0_g1_i5.p1  ORF type:complete len:206 (-),score=25.18 TRINITY_DN267_c0_g1_i5:202-819(-)
MQEADLDRKTCAAVSSLAYTELEHLQSTFVSRGVVALKPDSLGVPGELHDSILQRQKAVLVEQPKLVMDSMLAAHVPQVLDILNAPGLVRACELLLGPRYAIAPFTHNGMFPSGSLDQHWHSDDNAPLNARKQRHHQPVQAVLLYYPQEVGSDMGPTVMAPFSQYWTFDHETNHENFAGPEHLDFEYMMTSAIAEPGTTSAWNAP